MASQNSCNYKELTAIAKITFYFLMIRKKSKSNLVNSTYVTIWSRSNSPSIPENDIPAQICQRARDKVVKFVKEQGTN